MEHCWDIWIGANQFSRQFKSICADLWMMKCFSHYNSFDHRQKATSLSLLYYYFNKKFSDELKSLDPPIEILPARMQYAMFILISIILHWWWRSSTQIFLSKNCCIIEIIIAENVLWKMTLLFIVYPRKGELNSSICHLVSVIWDLATSFIFLDEVSHLV